MILVKCAGLTCVVPCSDPTWASANLGIFLCLNCSGCHRSLGVHISQVRSITMDAWFPDQIEVRAHPSPAPIRLRGGLLF